MKRIFFLALLCLLGEFAQAQPLQQKAITAINSTPTATCSANSCVVFDMRTQGTAQVQVTGTYTASGGLSLQSTVDGTTWVTVGGSGTFRRLSTGVSTATITSAEQGVYQLSGDCVGAYACRITALGAVTGTATVSVLTSSATAGGIANISGGAGDASAANQVAGNASLTSIDGKMVAGSGAVSSATQRVVAATDSPEVATLGAVADAAATQGSTGSVSAKLRTLTAQANTGNTSLASIDTKTPALGQAVAASSTPVVLPVLQNAVNTQGSTTSGQSGALIQGAVTTSAPTYTTGQTSPLSLDTSGQLRITGTVSAGGVAQGSTTSGQTGNLIQGAVTTSSPSYTTAQTSPLSLDTSGNLRVNVVTGGAGGGNVTGGTAHDAVGTSVNPVLVGGYSSAAAPTDVSADGDAVRTWHLRSGAVAVQQTLGGVLASAGNGASGTGVLRVTLANDSTPIGALTETAPASDTASAGLNGRLQRIAQNLTTQTAAINADPNYSGVIGAATAPTRMLTGGGVYNSSAPTLTNGQSAALQVSSAGRLLVDSTTNQTVNVAQINGTTPAMDTGNSSGGTQRHVIATNQPALPAHGHGAIGSAVPSGATLVGVQNSAGNMSAVMADPCMTSARTFYPVNISTATTTRIITPTASQKAYLCGVFLMSAGTQNVGIVEGTGGTCGTSTAGVIGGTTAGTGPNLTAQVGFVLPNTGFAQAATAGTNVDVCLITSAAVQLSGVVVYAKAP